MKSHTPGPWQCEPLKGRYVVADQHAYWLGSLSQPMHAHESKANARLIAAAPELLDALKALRDGAYGNPSYPQDNDRIDALADFAIAKAEGR